MLLDASVTRHQTWTSRSNTTKSRQSTVNNHIPHLTPPPPPQYRRPLRTFLYSLSLTFYTVTLIHKNVSFFLFIDTTRSKWTNFNNFWFLQDPEQIWRNWFWTCLSHRKKSHCTTLWNAELFTRLVTLFPQKCMALKTDSCVLHSNLNFKQATSWQQQLSIVTSVCVDTPFQSFSPLLSHTNYHTQLVLSLRTSYQKLLILTDIWKYSRGPCFEPQCILSNLTQCLTGQSLL